MKVLVEGPHLDGLAAVVPIGAGRYTIIDKSNSVGIRQFAWRVHKSHSREYAIRKICRAGRERLIFLHRWLTHCPPGMSVHHINGNTLDNRRDNLQIVNPRFHPPSRIFRVKPGRDK